MNEIKQRIESEGVMAVLRARSAGEAFALVEAMSAGRVTVIEVTMTTPGAAEILKRLRSDFGDRLLLGAGTVTTQEESAEMIAAGAEFVVSPGFFADVVDQTKAAGKVSIPGALTPTEVVRAWRAGADYVKVFPCSAMGGASYLKALKAPFPDIALIPTGGVTVATAADFLRAGAAALGVGSDLADASAIASGQPGLVTETARAYRREIARHRETLAASV